MPKTPFTPVQRGLLLANAVIAWAAVSVSFSLMAVGYYVDDIDPTKPTLLGNIPTGKDQVWERFFDWSSYFTILSNVVVAIVLTMLVRNPSVFDEKGRRGTIWRALRVDSLIMISITGIVYQLLLNEGGKVGWDLISDTLQHAVNPAVTVLVWLIVGPRGHISLRGIGHAMVLPIAWAVYALVRGGVIGAYPYFFLDVSTEGLIPVIVFIAQIMLFAIAIALVLLGYEKLRTRGR